MRGSRRGVGRAGARGPRTWRVSSCCRGRTTVRRVVLFVRCRWWCHHHRRCRCCRRRCTITTRRSSCGSCCRRVCSCSCCASSARGVWGRVESSPLRLLLRVHVSHIVHHVHHSSRRRRRVVVVQPRRSGRREVCMRVICDIDRMKVLSLNMLLKNVSLKAAAPPRMKVLREPRRISPQRFQSTTPVLHGQ